MQFGDEQRLRGASNSTKVSWGHCPRQRFTEMSADLGMYCPLDPDIMIGFHRTPQT